MRTCPRTFDRRHDAVRPPRHRPRHRLARPAARDVRRRGRGTAPPQRRLARDPRRVGETGVPRDVEPQPGVLRHRRRRRGGALRPLARRPGAREHRRPRRGRPADRHGHSPAAPVQPAALLAQPLEEHRLLGPRDVHGLLPPAVGLDPRGRGVRRRRRALRRPRLVKLLAFLLLAVVVHGPLSPLLPTAFEAILLYYARYYPAWLLAVIGTLGASLAEAANYRLVDWAAQRPALAGLWQIGRASC